MPMTNEERFVASCKSVGESDVRQKLLAGRYTERRAAWATSWLDQVEAGKSEATKAAERATGLRKTGKSGGYFGAPLGVLILGSILALSAFLVFR